MPQGATNRRTVNPVFLIIGLGVIAVFAAVWNARRETPERVLSLYLRLAADNKEDEAQNYESQTALATEPPMPPRRSGRAYVPHLMLWDMNPQGLPGAQFQIGRSKVDGDRAEVPLTVRFPSLTRTIPVYLILEEGGWRIDMKRTNTEIQKVEEQLNVASAATTSGSQALSATTPSGR